MKHLVWIAVGLLVGCQSTSTKKNGLPSPEVPASVTEDARMKNDRSRYDADRKDIPAELQRDNDELAFVRDLMKDGTEEPSRVRERFSNATRKRREHFDKAMTRIREDFNKKEKASREAFLKKLKDEREEFMKQNPKLKAEKRKEFFDEQEAQRQDYFNDERDNRKDFESNSTERRKDFEAYMTEKTNEFNQEMREYSNAYYDRKKNLQLKKDAEEKARVSKPAASSSAPAKAADPDLDEFKKIPKTPATPLTPPESGN